MAAGCTILQPVGQLGNLSGLLIVCDSKVLIRSPGTT
jgi:hypothetical protein